MANYLWHFVLVKSLSADFTALIQKYGLVLVDARSRRIKMVLCERRDGGQILLRFLKCSFALECVFSRLNRC